MNRLAIYFFYDKDGIADEYVRVFLEDLKKNVSEICIVCNGKLQEESAEKLKPYGRLLVRENEGFDVWAYRTALLEYGWEALAAYDEVIMLNSTLMGPVYPLAETFAKMDAEEVDFWGISQFFEYPADPSGCCRYGYIPDHIQSHFIACRRRLVESREFHEYWETMPMIATYWESIGRHEMVFTKYFADLGYRWKTSVEMDDLRQYNGYPLMMCPRKLMEERRCPLFKRRSFFHDADDYLRNTAGEAVSELFDYIRNKTDYPEDVIWETILRNYNLSDIAKDMNLTYILPTGLAGEETSVPAGKTALVVFLYMTTQLEQIYHYAHSMPRGADVYVITPIQEAEELEKIKIVFAGLGAEKLVLKQVETTERDVVSLFEMMREEIHDYSLACFIHDQPGFQMGMGTAAAGLAHRYLENTLASREYVRNILATFAENPRLGLLTCPKQNHGPYFPTIGKEWGESFGEVRRLADELEICVSIEESKPPMASFDTMFWFRPEALEKLFAHRWNVGGMNVKDKEPQMQAVLRLIPFAAQQEGYYSGICMADRMAGIEYGNLRYYTRGYNETLMRHGIESYYDDMHRELDRRLKIIRGDHFLSWVLKKRIKLAVKRLLGR